MNFTREKIRQCPIFTKLRKHMCFDETKRKVNYYKLFVRGHEKVTGGPWTLPVKNFLSYVDWWDKKPVNHYQNVRGQEKVTGGQWTLQGKILGHAPISTVYVLSYVNSWAQKIVNHAD